MSISYPLASKKQKKLISKTLKKAIKKEALISGVKDVQKAIRKGSKGIVLMEANVSPIDTISHFPILCEDNELLYMFVEDEFPLPRPACIVLIDEEKSSLFQKYYDSLKLELSPS